MDFLEIPKDVFEEVLFFSTTKEAINISAVAKAYREHIESFNRFWWYKFLILKKFEGSEILSTVHIGKLSQTCVRAIINNFRIREDDPNNIVTVCYDKLQGPPTSYFYEKRYYCIKNYDKLIGLVDLKCNIQNHYETTNKKSPLDVVVSENKLWMWEYLFESYRIIKRKDAYQKKRDATKTNERKSALIIDINAKQKKLDELKKILSDIEKIESYTESINSHPFHKSTPARYIKAKAIEQKK